jgi:hypothetical protein
VSKVNHTHGVFRRFSLYDIDCLQCADISDI